MGNGDVPQIEPGETTAPTPWEREKAEREFVLKEAELAISREDLAIKRREIELNAERESAQKEAELVISREEVTIKKRELELKEEDQRYSRWLNPVFLGLRLQRSHCWETSM